MLSNASKYAIRAVLFLADKSSITRKFKANQISEELEIPNYFIAKILQNLAKKNVITSVKGPNGGFYLTEKNKQLRACDIINSIEIKSVFEGCFLGLPECRDERPCPVHFEVLEFREKLLDKFEKHTIQEFSEEIKTGGTFITLKGS